MDNERARAVVLDRSDFPEWFRADKSSFGHAVIPQCSYYPGDRSHTTVTGSARAAFTDGSNMYGSTASWFRTRADLDAYWKQTVRPAFARCYASYVARTWIGETRTHEVKEIELPDTGAKRIAAYRTVTSVIAKDVKPYIWYDTVVFLEIGGRGLVEFRIGNINKPCTCPRAIARSIVRRMRAVS